MLYIASFANGKRGNIFYISSMVKVNTSELLELFYSFPFAHKKCNSKKRYQNSKPATQKRETATMEQDTNCVTQH
jgi:hypothetical protein